MERYILNYLKQVSNDPVVLKYIDMLKVELDWHFYADGEDLATKYHRQSSQSLYWYIYKKSQELFALCSKFPEKNKKLILTMFRFPSEIKGFDIYSSISHPVGTKNIVGNYSILKGHHFTEKVIHNYPFNQTLEHDTLQRIEKYENDLFKLYFEKCNFKALFVYSDQLFWAKQHIGLFKKMNKPTFVFSHGLPGIYSLDVDNRADYLMVWGDKVKENYIKAGFEANKIKVIGNFRYKDFDFKRDLRNNKESILVATTSTREWHQNTWNSMPLLSDPSNLLIYLEQVKRVLLNNNVKHVRLRPHPSVDKQWLDRFIDKSFFSIDNEDLITSLQSSTLVIGPTSSVVVEAIMNGVNYITYEPTDDTMHTYSNNVVVPPFDGSDENLCVAKNEEELDYLIRGNYCTNPCFLEGYIQPFNPGVVEKELLNI